MNDNNSFLFLHEVYLAAAALAGAVTSLSLLSWQTMTRMEIIMTLMVGFSFAVFVTPYIAHELLGVPPSNIRLVAALTYMFGSGCNVLLPLMIRRISRMLGDEEGKDA